MTERTPELTVDLRQPDEAPHSVQRRLVGEWENTE